MGRPKGSKNKTTTATDNMTTISTESSAPESQGRIDLHTFLLW